MWFRWTCPVTAPTAAPANPPRFLAGQRASPRVRISSLHFNSGLRRCWITVWRQAADGRIRAVAAFAPLTDLLVLREFAGQEANPLVQRLALAYSAQALADCAAWITIGNADERVDTDKVVAFTRTLVAAARLRGLLCNVSVHLLPVMGHASFPEDHDNAAHWLFETLTPDARPLLGEQ